MVGTGSNIEVAIQNVLLWLGYTAEQNKHQHLPLTRLYTADSLHLYEHLDASFECIQLLAALLSTFIFCMLWRHDLHTQWKGENSLLLHSVPPTYPSIQKY